MQVTGSSSEIRHPSPPPHPSAQGSLDKEIDKVSTLFPGVTLQNPSKLLVETVAASAKNPAIDERNMTEIMLKTLPSAAGSGHQLVNSASSSTALTKAGPIETRVALADFEKLKSFWQKWSSRPIAITGRDNPDLIEIQKGFPLNSQLQCLDKLHQYHQLLSNCYKKGKVKSMSRQELAMRNDYTFQLSLLSTLFHQMCLRDTTIVQRDCNLYRKMYQEEIDPHLQIFQRYSNFLHKMLESEQATELKHPLRLLKFESSTLPFTHSQPYLAFLRDSRGWLPIPLNFNSKTLEVSYIYYGESSLPSTKAENNHQSLVMIVDHGELVTQNGFLIEITKTDQESMVDIIGYFGPESSMPFLTTPLTKRLFDADAAGMVKTLSPIIPEIDSFLNDLSSQRELYFLPLNLGPDEREEFHYCLLLEAILQSRSANRPEQQAAAVAFIKQLEQAEGKPIEEVLKEQEKVIKAKLRTEYEREVEEEQQLRSKQVAEGKTAGAGPSKKKKKGQTASKSPAPATKSVDERIEQGFKTFLVKGPIKYRRLIQLTKDMLKKSPETLSKILQDENQRGSHHILHTQQGPVTLVEPHGKKDRTISARVANRFCDAVLEQMRKSIESLKEDSNK
ncbi:MAG: hypothetical protein LLG04_00665 [Parachlamydia sp.]|nr:hypothetical protein [Parachlamydia sp.]